MERAFGRLHAPDENDKRYHLELPVKASTRRYRYWRDDVYFGNQGNKPHCVGYAWMHWLVNAPTYNYLDPNGIYRLAQHIDEWDGTDYAGTSVRAGAKILKNMGVIVRYEWAWDLRKMVEALLERGPLVVGTDWTQGMDRPDNRGIIRATGRNMGGHAYLISGVSKQRKMFRVKNSWGKGWGLSGRAWLPFEDMDKLIKASGEVCLAVERSAKHPSKSRSSIQSDDEETAPTVKEVQLFRRKHLKRRRMTDAQRKRLQE